MPGTNPNVVTLWPDDHVLSVELDLTSTPERAVVHVVGDLDMATAPALLEALTGLAGLGCRHVDVDLREVAFCDGSGLAVLLEAHRRLGANGGGMTLHDPCPSLLRILDICDLTLDLQARGPAPAHEPSQESVHEPAQDPGGGSVDGSPRPHLTLLPSLRDVT